MKTIFLGTRSVDEAQSRFTVEESAIRCMTDWVESTSGMTRTISLTPVARVPRSPGVGLHSRSRLDSRHWNIPSTTPYQSNQ